MTKRENSNRRHPLPRPQTNGPIRLRSLLPGRLHRRQHPHKVRLGELPPRGERKRIHHT